jgi:hypothetical protein
MTCHLTKRWGEGVANPCESDLLSALDELKQSDPEHPDCWVSDEGGWSLSAHEGGLVVLENIETDEGPWHMRGVKPETVLQYWQMLIRGDIALLRALSWKGGYG